VDGLWIDQRQIGPHKEFSSIVLEKTRGHFKSAVHNGTHRVIGRIFGNIRAIGANIHGCQDQHANIVANYFYDFGNLICSCRTIGNGESMMATQIQTKQNASSTYPIMCT
jgi:hypothetical protein